MLRPIKPEDISFEWERVKVGLAEVKKATSDDWLPEDIYMSIKTGNAVLYIGEDDCGNYLGFLVLQLLPSFHAKSLHIWCGYSATKEPLMKRFLPEIQEIAKQAQAGKIMFSSDRPEWQKVAKRLGFKPTKTYYVSDL